MIGLETRTMCETNKTPNEKQSSLVICPQFHVKLRYYWVFLLLWFMVYAGQMKIVCSLLQAERDGLLYTVVLGVIHGID